MEIINYINHVRDRIYMSGIERDIHRVKVTAEVFTKTELVIEILDKIELTQTDIFINPIKTFIDNCCGDGQFLSEVIIRKMERSGCSLEQALSTTYGVEFMGDNVNECRKRLAGPDPTPEILEIVTKNIVHHDALTYDYSFGEEEQDETIKL
jgi:hypothetical protein